MRMNRRNVLVGLGAIVASGGAALGTGAFSSVEADRTVSVDVAGDSSAFLQLTSNNGYVEENGGTIEINLDSTGGTTNSNGLNTNATTTIDSLFTATNESDSSIEFRITTGDSNATVNDGTAIENNVNDTNGDPLDTIEFVFEDSNGNVIVSDTEAMNTVSIGSGGAEDITLDITVPDIDPSNINNDTLLSSITIVAE